MTVSGEKGCFQLMLTFFLNWADVPAIANSTRTVFHTDTPFSGCATTSQRLFTASAGSSMRNVSTEPKPTEWDVASAMALKSIETDTLSASAWATLTVVVPVVSSQEYEALAVPAVRIYWRLIDFF